MNAHANMAIVSTMNKTLMCFLHKNVTSTNVKGTLVPQKLPLVNVMICLRNSAHCCALGQTRGGFNKNRQSACMYSHKRMCLKRKRTSDQLEVCFRLHRDCCGLGLTLPFLEFA